ncbi:MAG: riboflavin biosynthesis protein RibF [Clostridia bacterium]|nr:riboflavin biosynthesis protein RibF [Clostridia bacterium]
MNNSFKIFWSDRYKEERPIPKNSVLALGTFDGIHIAHKKLLFEALDLKNRIQADFAGAWCFEQSPASILRGVDIPALTTLYQKISIMLSQGLDFVAVGDFKSFSSVTAEDFIDNILVNELGCVATVCGFNHKFGYKGLGNSNLLRSKFSCERVIEVDEITMFGETVSSTSIREKISSGDIEKANAMLGRCFSLSSAVVHGKRLGREMQFPTANQCFPSELIVPKHGIYATVCTLEDGSKYMGVSNVGVRPTISDDIDTHVANCETYICDFSGDIYGQKLTIEFCAYLREEKRFSSIDELSLAISHDKANAIEFFKNTNLNFS